MNRTHEYYSIGLLAQWVLAAVRLIVFDLTHGWLNLFQLVQSIAAGGKPFVIQVRRTGHQFKVISAGDVWTIDEVFVRNEYQWDRVNVPPDAIILDVGSNIGAFAVWARTHYPLGAIYAYEPFPSSYTLLRENLAQNGIHDVRTFPLAVWSTSATLVMNTDFPFASMYSTEEADSPQVGGLRVQAISLDSIFEMHHLARCDILKLDCEGAEYEILLNESPVTLRRVQFILAEYHDNRTASNHIDLVNHLRKHGFEVEIRPNHALKDVGYLFAANVMAGEDTVPAVSIPGGSKSWPGL